MQEPLKAEPHVVILMPVRNGAVCLHDQLEIIAQQSYANWSLYTSDDGSTDGSKDILKEFAAGAGVVHVSDGPQNGQTANVVALLGQASQALAQGSWLAFADQDDVWLPTRLSRGIKMLQGVDGPAFYCSRTIIADENLENRHLSKAHFKPSNFRNALVQNICSANTMLLNADAAQLIQSESREVEAVIAPDWWIYMLITGAGGQVVFDQEPSLIYRQHGRNQFGGNKSLMASARRMAMMMRGDYSGWVDINIRSMQQSEHRLSGANRQCLADFARMRDGNAFQRVAAFRKLGLHRQSRSGTFALWCAAFLGGCSPRISLPIAQCSPLCSPSTPLMRNTGRKGGRFDLGFRSPDPDKARFSSCTGAWLSGNPHKGARGGVSAGSGA